MTTKLLMEIYNKRMFLELALTIIVYMITWFVSLKLGFRILGLKVGLRRFLPGVLIGTVYSLLIKPFTPDLPSIIIVVVLTLASLKIFGKVRFIKAFWAALLVLLIVIMGTILIESPLWSLDEKFAAFFMETAYGNIVGTLIEVLFPVIVLFILSTLNIALIPPLAKKLTLFDFVGVYLFGALFYWVFTSNFRLVISWKQNPQQFFGNLVSEWVAAFSAVIGFYVVQTMARRQREHEKRLFEDEKRELQLKYSERLILTLASRDREIRNRLQVLSVMAESGKNEELKGYVFRIADEIKHTKITNIENPVLSSIVLSEKILASEKKIDLEVFGHASLVDFTKGLNTLGMAFIGILELFIENEIMSNCAMGKVSLILDEDQDYGYFHFKISNDAKNSLLKNKFKDYQMIFFQAFKKEASDKFRMVNELIREIGGKVEYVIQGDHVVELKLKIKKSPDEDETAIVSDREDPVFKEYLDKRK